MSRAAVVVNPSKLADPETFRAAVRAAMTEHGWSEPIWLETTPDDPGEGQARTAAASGVDLVLACGGDGTVTASAAGLVATGIPLAIIPLGTGNLLARNLGLPIDLGHALTVALTGGNRQLDVGVANGRLFLTMAGLGLDAKMLDDASEAVKRRFGWGAYVGSALRHLWDRPMRVSLRTDSGSPLQRRASVIIVGNVGTLQGGLPLLPGAQPDDGRLDMVVLTARTLAGWLAVALHVLLRRPGATARVIRRTCTEASVEVDRAHRWEIDGEVMGRTRELIVTVRPGALLVRVPATSPGGMSG
ncbi:MAG TPA: diacylglycerol kinase family protein [Streptosporangiaceae bacterium]|jgi:YegS/Rv2252/BmrU family lipid kinase|nr:diacylglycerol kinase family protein [Streptosporangiaceae bacterium]